MKPEAVDLVVIGAGPAGISAAIAAAEAGARVVLLDCARGLVTEGRWIRTSLLAQAPAGVPAP